MNSEYIYLDDINTNTKTFNKLPAGIKYNCFKCKKIMETQPYGSYKYCLSCFNRWEKTKKDKVLNLKQNIEKIEEFIED